MRPRHQPNRKESDNEERRDCQDESGRVARIRATDSKRPPHPYDDAQRCGLSSNRGALRRLSSLPARTPGALETAGAFGLPLPLYACATSLTQQIAHV